MPAHMHSDCFLTIEASYQVSWSTKGTSTSYNPTIKIQKRYYKINQKQSNSRATNHNRWFCGRRIRCGPWKSVSGFQLWSPAQRKYSVIYKVSQNPRKKSKTSIAWQKKNQQSDQRKNKANGITSHATSAGENGELRWTEHLQQFQNLTIDAAIVFLNCLTVIWETKKNSLLFLKQL